MKLDLRPPGGSITWLAALWMLCSVLCVSFIVQGRAGTWIWLVAGLCFAVVSVGLWFRQGWARWAGVGVTIVLLLLGITSFVRDGVSFNNILKFSIVLWYFWALWEWDVRKDAAEHEVDGAEGEKKMVSLVQFLREPRYLDAQILANMASRAWGKTVTAGGNEGEKDLPIFESSPFVVGESPNLIAMCDGLFFSILNMSAPYVPDVEKAAESTNNLRVRQPLVEHRAWLAVDVIGGDEDPESVARGYRYIGKLHAELLDDNCLALFQPATNRLYPMEPDMEAKLRSDDPLTALQEHPLLPVIQVADDDPRMRAAVAEARRRWPEFVRAFESRDGNDNFAVKAAITDGEHTEYMWLIVTAIENDIAYGRIDNDPLNVQGVKLGDIRRVAGSEIWDWLYMEGGEMVGGFSVAVVREIQSSGDESAS
jgi:uncharacterized protein YegJ (DUF2314 family)